MCTSPALSCCYLMPSHAPATLGYRILIKYHLHYQTRLRVVIKARGAGRPVQFPGLGLPCSHLTSRLLEQSDAPSIVSVHLYASTSFPAPSFLPHPVFPSSVAVLALHTIY